MESQECSLKFKGSSRTDPAQLAEFLFLFRAVYAAAVRLDDGLDRGTAPEVVRKFAQKLVKNLKSLDAGELNQLFYQDLGQNKLTIENISHHSPPELYFVGSFFAILVIATVLSGGSVEVAGVFKIELKQSLGKAIKELRDALASRKKTQIGYGVLWTRVKLSTKELNELDKLNPAQRERGGFQRLLVDLQKRVNRKTGVLVLNSEDIDRIIRFGSKPSRGGFQNRIHKIFKRNFKFDDPDA